MNSSMFDSKPRLILLPGLGADERMYAPQCSVFPRLEVPRWLSANPHESLADYSRRMAATIEVSEPFFLGGSSFGGAVALEMARHLKPRAVFLIASCRTPMAIPRHLRFIARCGGWFARGPVLWTAHAVASRSTSRFGELAAEQRTMLVAMIRDADPKFLRWGGDALARWSGAADLDVPIHQIHGEADRILPCGRSGTDVAVPGAGHLMNVTHADEVNRFLAARMR
jgi:pimeloyl-ACP methyl ester carboxylesterase